MTRQLRARASRPNYAELAGLDAEDDIAGPSTSDHDIIESDGSGSEFEPDAAAPEEQVQDDAEDMALDDEGDGDGDAEIDNDNDESASAAPRRPIAPNRGRVSASASAIPGPSSRRKSAQQKATGTGRRSVALLPGGLAHSSSRQMNALPSLHHRHRSMGICGKQGKIERLRKAPVPFEEGATVQTNAWACNSTISDRVNKSWGYNVGPGPLWELLEDRTWFKEAAGSSRTTERELRPRVHERIATGQLQVLSSE